MKKFFFWLLLIITLFLSFKIGRILIVDFHRLTNYGFGYLTGLVILFLITTSLVVSLWIRIYVRKNSPDDSAKADSPAEMF